MGMGVRSIRRMAGKAGLEPRASHSVPTIVLHAYLAGTSIQFSISAKIRHQYGKCIVSFFHWRLRLVFA
jgi:hypothetical protein